MRRDMGESRLYSLALMHIKYDMPVDLDEIVTLFQGPTRGGCSSQVCFTNSPCSELVSGPNIS